jgi:hypothetical protein
VIQTAPKTPVANDFVGIYCCDRKLLLDIVVKQDSVPQACDYEHPLWDSGTGVQQGPYDMHRDASDTVSAKRRTRLLAELGSLSNQQTVELTFGDRSPRHDLRPPEPHSVLGYDIDNLGWRRLEEKPGVGPDLHNGNVGACRQKRAPKRAPGALAFK